MTPAQPLSSWMIASTALMLAWIPCALVALRGDLSDRLVGLEMAGVIQTCLFVLLAEAFQRPAFIDLALTVAFLTFGGGMVFARFLERWL